MPNLKSLSLTVQKFIAKIKVDNRKTNRQTDRQTGQNNMPPIIRSGGIKIILYITPLCTGHGFVKFSLVIFNLAK